MLATSSAEPEKEQEQVDLAATPIEDQSVQQEEAPKKKSRKKGRWVSAEDVMPRPSPWPIALAGALAWSLISIAFRPLLINIGTALGLDGFATYAYPILLLVGLLLVIVVVVGWFTERR